MEDLIYCGYDLLGEVVQFNFLTRLRKRWIAGISAEVEVCDLIMPILLSINVVLMPLPLPLLLGKIGLRLEDVLKVVKLAYDASGQVLGQLGHLVADFWHVSPNLLKKVRHQLKLPGHDLLLLTFRVAKVLRLGLTLFSDV